MFPVWWGYVDRDPRDPFPVKNVPILLLHVSILKSNPNLILNPVPAPERGDWAQSKPSEYQQNQREGGKLESHLREILKRKKERKKL